MNQTVRPPKVPKKPPRKPRDHTAFLPAALEILETPASPIRAALIWFISVFVILAIVWSYFGRFDIVATAQGKLQPTGRVKVIQSLETGKTAAIPVANGSKVKAGDIVVELDPTETRAEVDALLASLRSLRAEVTRRTTARAQVEAWQRGGLWSKFVDDFGATYLRRGYPSVHQNPRGSAVRVIAGATGLVACQSLLATRAAARIAWSVQSAWLPPRKT